MTKYHNAYSAYKWATLGVATMLTVAVLSLGNAWANAGQDASAEFFILRQVQSSGIVPVVGEYVGYEVTLKNNGSSPIENQFLWVHFFSANGKSDSQAAFSIHSLTLGESRQFHIGPFKMLESGKHCLNIGVNRDGEVGAPNQVSLNYLPNQCVDSLTVYHPWFATFLPAGIGIASAGALFLVWYFKRRHA